MCGYEIIAGRSETARRGAALASVLMVACLAMVIAFALAQTSVFHMSVSTRERDSRRARDMAESVMAVAVERLMTDTAYGTPTGPGYTTVLQVQASSSDGEAEGMLAFSSATAGSVPDPLTGKCLRIPWSTNNLEKDAPTDGCARRVPKYGAHLVGTGICNGVVRRMEALIHIPPFPFVIASSGKFTSAGGLLVAGIAKPEDALRLDADKLLPGHLAANSSDATEAIVLGPGTKVTGNVRAPGGIKLDPNGGAVILGEICSNAAPVKLPAVDVKSYDPAASHTEGVQDLPAKLENQKLEGFCRRQGDLEVSGDLELRSATLYVDGNLRISGGVKGKGGVFVTGTTTVGKGAAVDTDNVAALLSKGNVSLGGYGKGSSAFQGIVYTQGDFTAENITLLGSFIANGEGSRTDLGAQPGTGQDAAAAKGSMTMNSANLVEMPQYTSITFEVKAPAPKPTVTPAPPAAPAFSGAVFQSSGQGTDTRLLSPWASVQYFVSLWPVLNIEAVKDTSTSPPTYRSSLVTKSNSVGIAFGRTNPWSNQLLSYDQAAAKFASDPNYAFCRAAAMQDAEIAVSRIKADVDAYNTRYQQYVASLTQSTGGATAGPGTTVKDGKATFTFDLNKFLSIKDRMRVCLWREWKD